MTPTPPDYCPLCEQPLAALPSQVPSPRWQMRARLLLLAGAVVSAFLLVPALVYSGLLAYHVGVALGLHRSEANLIRWLGFGVLFLVALGPGLVCGWVAMRVPRVRTWTCRHCGWARTYLVQHR